MQAVQYQFSIPKYVITKVYNVLGRGKLPPIFPNISYVKDLPKPKLNGENWVILRSLMSGVCGSDINLARATESYSMEPYASFPCVLGHENVSEVVELGNNVKDLALGDRVIVNPAMGCRTNDRESLCGPCSKGLDALCDHFGDEDKLGAGMSLGYHKATGGGWSEYYQAHQWQIHKISKDIPLKRAVLADPLSSAMQPIAEYAAGKSEEKTVLIYGAGSIGLLAVASIRALKLPWKVILGYRYGFQAEMGKRLGADHMVQTGRGFYQEICKLTGGKIRKVSIGTPVVEGGVDVVFDCVGSPKTLDDSLRLTKTKGTVMMIATGDSLAGVDPSPIWFREINLVGTCMSRDIIDPRDGEKKSVYQIVGSLLPELEIEDLVTHTYPISSFKEALIAGMSKKRDAVIKIAFDLDDALS